MEDSPTIDIIIPSFNGKYLLEKHLPEIIRHSKNLNKVIVVDNGSTDGTVTWLENTYPDIVIVKNNTNLGFTKPVNQGVAASKAKYFILMNNDVSPQKDYLKDILGFFDDSQVFAVSFNENESSWPLVVWENGKIQFTQGKDKSAPVYSLWASGGSAIYKRSIWDKLGGLNEVYAPFYWEDIGIGYRAWKSGYKIIWSNKAPVLHQHESTAKKISQSYVNLIKQRNELLFTWINVTDKNLLHSHLNFLLSHSIKHPGYFKVIFSALLRYFSNRQKNNFVRTDREVLSMVNKKYEKN